MSPQIARRNVFASAGLALIALLPGPVMADPQDVEAIKSRLQQYAVRFNRGDAEAVSQLYGEDVVYYGPLGRVFRGRVAVKEHYQGNLTAGFSDMAIDVIEIEVLDDTAYDLARYTIVGPQGQPLEGYHLAILEKEDGGWVVQRTLVNVVMPQPPKDSNRATQ